MAISTRRKLAGGVVLGVAAIAFYLGMQFKGPGLGGSGSGDGGPAPGETSRSPISVNTDTTSTDLVGDLAPPVTPAVVPTLASPLVTVVISGDKYLLSTTEDLSLATPAELAEVARAALSVEGDSQGIRVRIFRKKDATAGAKIDLFVKLDDAGIPTQSIQEMPEFLD